MQPSNSHHYDLIIFDWDGTLADSTQLIVDAICKASLDAQLSVPTQESARGIIGLGLREALLELFGNVPEHNLQQLLIRYNHHYGSEENDIPLFTGAMDTVRALYQRGIRLAVATGKGRNGLNRALQRSGLQPYFHATRCVDECHSKPHPQMILELMDELEATPERTLMVGDTSFDLQMAQNAQVSSVAVTYGAHPLDRLLPHEPLAHFHAFEELQTWLLQNA